MTSNIVLQGMSAGQTLVTVGYGGTYTAPPTPTGSGGLLDPYWRRKKKDENEELFIMVKELLEAFM